MLAFLFLEVQELNHMSKNLECHKTNRFIVEEMPV